MNILDDNKYPLEMILKKGLLRDTRLKNKPGYYCRTSPVDECSFCITFSFTAEGYTESTLMSGSNIQA